jgi:hypothetical protein
MLDDSAERTLLHQLSNDLAGARMYVAATLMEPDLSEDAQASLQGADGMLDQASDTLAALWAAVGPRPAAPNPRA